MSLSCFLKCTKMVKIQLLCKQTLIKIRVFKSLCKDAVGHGRRKGNGLCRPVSSPSLVPLPSISPRLPVHAFTLTGSPVDMGFVV